MIAAQPRRRPVDRRVVAGRPRPRKKRQPWESTMLNSASGSRAWTRLVARVCKEEPICRLRLPCCTIRSTTADHIHPRSQRPDLTEVRSNLRGSCKPCNIHRGDRPLEQVRAEMIASGKWTRKRAPALDFFKKES